MDKHNISHYYCLGSERVLRYSYVQLALDHSINWAVLCWVGTTNSLWRGGLRHCSYTFIHKTGRGAWTFERNYFEGKILQTHLRPLWPTIYLTSYLRKYPSLWFTNHLSILYNFTDSIIKEKRTLCFVNDQINWETALSTIPGLQFLFVIFFPWFLQDW